MRYRRTHCKGATYFFTANLVNRSADTLVRHIDALRASLVAVKAARPFALVAMVVLPDHLHAIWRLPQGDADYPQRWALFKAGFSRRIGKHEPISASREKQRERGLWQRRYWEHIIRDENDLLRHMDYIHLNPVKHGWVKRPADWPYSSLHGYIARGIFPPNWAGHSDDTMDVWGEM